MTRCPACSRWIETPVCRLCQVPGVATKFHPGPAPEIWRPWMIAGTFASLLLPLLHPLLFLAAWPLLSTIFARALYLNLAVTIQDSFLRIFVGALLVMLAGVLALSLLSFPLMGGFGIWFNRRW